MRYYHDEKAKAVYAEPDEPMVEPKMETRTKRRQHPKRLGCTVWMAVEVTRADNWFDPSRNQWAHPIRPIISQHYDDRDSDSQAVAFFRERHMGKWGTPIDDDTYQRLKAEYETAAKSNPVPTST